MKAGHYIRREDMKAWLLSWGTEHELPPPKCVCGKVHDSVDEVQEDEEVRENEAPCQ